MVLMGCSGGCSGEVSRCSGSPEGSGRSPEGLFQGASAVVREGVSACSVGSKLRGSGDALAHAYRSLGCSAKHNWTPYP